MSTVDTETDETKLKTMKYWFGTLNYDVWTMSNSVLISKTNENLQTTSKYIISTNIRFVHDSGKIKSEFNHSASKLTAKTLPEI